MILNLIKVIYLLWILIVAFLYLNGKFQWFIAGFPSMPLLMDSEGFPYSTGMLIFGIQSFRNWYPDYKLEITVLNDTACRRDIPPLSGIVLSTVKGGCSPAAKVFNLQESGADVVVFESSRFDMINAGGEDEDIMIPAMIVNSVDFDALRHSEYATISSENIPLVKEFDLIRWLSVGVLYKAVAWAFYYWKRRNYQKTKNIDLV